jgi:hypothetical protein
MYTSEAKLASYLNTTITTGSAKIYIESAQRYIEQITRRKFEADKNASARLFDGDDRQELIIDDCIEVTKVEVGNNIYGDTFTEVTNDTQNNYFLMPTNYASEGLPIRKIGLRSLAWIYGHANHRITAKWGYSELPPDDIVFAATVIASGMYYQNQGQNSGAITREKIGNYEVAFADQKGVSDAQVAQSILESYKKYEL